MVFRIVHLILCYSVYTTSSLFSLISMYRIKNAHVNCVTMKLTIVFERTPVQGNGVLATNTCAWVCVCVHVRVLLRRWNEGAMICTKNFLCRTTLRTKNEISNGNAFDVQQQQRVYCVLKPVNDATTTRYDKVGRTKWSYNNSIKEVQKKNNESQAA